MLQRKITYLLILALVASSWVVGFYFGRKSETDKQLNFAYSISHAETLIRSIELVKSSQYDQANKLMIDAMDSSLFTVFLAVSSDNNSVNEAEMARVVKLINKIDEVLSREDASYLVPVVTDETSKKEYHSYIQKGLEKIRAFEAKYRQN